MINQLTGEEITEYCKENNIFKASLNPSLSIDGLPFLYYLIKENDYYIVEHLPLNDFKKNVHYDYNSIENIYDYVPEVDFSEFYEEEKCQPGTRALDKKWNYLFDSILD